MRSTDRESAAGKLADLLLIGLYLLVVLGPIVALLSDLARVNVSDWADLLFPNARQQQLWIRSVGLALAVAIAGMALGICGALWLQDWTTGWRTGLRWSFLLLAPLPPVTHAMAWSWGTGRLNQILARSGLRQVPFQGWAAAWWVQTIWLLPVAIGLALVALTSVQRRLKEAGRLLGPELRTLMRVTLPLAAPMLLAGGGILFLLSLVDYTIPSLCQINVAALDIFADFSVHNRPGRALLVSTPLLLTTFGALALSQAPLRPAALTPDWHRASDARAREWPLGLQAALGIALFLTAVGFSVPLLSLVIQARSVRTLVATAVAARAEIMTSMGTAAAAAVLSLPPAYAAARVTARAATDKGPTSSLWWLAITVPLAMPGPLVGIGLITLWNRPGWAGLGPYGSGWMPVLAAMARYTPIGALILVAALRRLNPRLTEAAQLLETSRLRTWLRVHMPLLGPGLITAAGVVFSLTLGELSATLLVSPPGQPTLTMRIYNYLHYGASETVAGLTLVLTGLVLVFGLLVLGTVTSRGRRGGGLSAGSRAARTSPIDPLQGSGR